LKTGVVKTIHRGFSTLKNGQPLDIKTDYKGKL